MKMDCSPFPYEVTTVSSIKKYNRRPTIYTKCMCMVKRFTFGTQNECIEKMVSNITKNWTGKTKLLSK